MRVSSYLEDQQSSVVAAKRPDGKLSHARVSTRVLRSFQEVEEVRESWAAWHRHPNSDIDFFLTVIKSRPHIVRPHAVVAYRDGTPVSILAGRIELIKLEIKLGYKCVCRVPVKSLTLVYEGLLGEASEETVPALLNSIGVSLRDREADLVHFSHLEAGSFFELAVRTHGGVLQRDRFPAQGEHWSRPLPDNYELLLKSFSSHYRGNLRRNAKRVMDALGSELSVECFRDPAVLDRFIADASKIAQKTYHRGLGVGFVDNAETRQLLSLECSRGWFRGYILYLGKVPCAFWEGQLYAGTFFTGATGYEAEYRAYGLGRFLLHRMIEDLCRGRSCRTLDFGFGGAEYKSDLCNEMKTELSYYLFAPTLKGCAINLLRTPVIYVDRILRRVLAKAGLLQKIKSLWRRRLSQCKVTASES